MLAARGPAEPAGKDPMLSPELQDALNQHLTREYSAALTYLSMASYFESRNLPGFSGWMRAQYEDELSHVARFFDFVHQRGGRVRLGVIPAPQHDWESPLAVFRHAHEQECGVTTRIHQLVDLALKESDHATNAFLQWFVKEQVEEEATTAAIAGQLDMVGDDGAALLLMDRELSARKPSTAAGSATDVFGQR